MLACYSAGERRMYIPDRDPGSGALPASRATTRSRTEYGHHIANFRSNAPFPGAGTSARSTGPATSSCAWVRTRACTSRAIRGRTTSTIPAEAFADSYAHLPENGFSNVPWQFNERLRPDAGAFAALRRDVLDPWRGSTRKVVRGSLNSRHRSRTTSFRTSLDGTVDLRLRGPASANFDIGIYDGSRLISRTRTAGSRDHLRLTVCRESSPDRDRADPGHPPRGRRGVQADDAVPVGAAPGAGAVNGGHRGVGPGRSGRSFLPGHPYGALGRKVPTCCCSATVR